MQHSAALELPLNKMGKNCFKVCVFSSDGSSIPLQLDPIAIMRTTATIDAIPASHDIFIEVLEKLGGKSGADYLVRAGDALPKKGTETFKAAETLRANMTNSLNFKIWEGEIETPIEDNRPIGVLKISGHDFDQGVIPIGAELICEYEILDSGNITLEVSVPSIGSTFHSGKNFYSRQEGQLDYSLTNEIIAQESEKTLERVNKVHSIIQDPQLDQAIEKLQTAKALIPDKN